jgi:nucleotide-binding universal stress UspA family protein
MNARGSTEVIIATIGLSMGALSQNLFTLIVTMAVITTVAMPPMLRWSLSRVPMREDERIRLEREEIDARGFVTNLERLLLVVDDSPNGKFAARLAGVIGGAIGKPTTVLELTEGRADKKAGNRKASAKTPAKSWADEEQSDDSTSEVKSAAEQVTTLHAHPEDKKQGSIDVTTVRKSNGGPEEIEAEARKGYDFLIVGVGETRASNGGFAESVSEIAAKFTGPVAIVDTHGTATDRLLAGLAKIVVPVNGTEVSRRAAEVAFALARASDAQVTVLYVTSPADGKKPGRGRSRAERRNDKAVLKDISALAKRYSVNVRRSMPENAAPVDAILKEARRGYDLIVVGANRRPGDTLFFGNTAAAILDRAPTAKLFVAS